MGEFTYGQTDGCGQVYSVTIRPSGAGILHVALRVSTTKRAQVGRIVISVGELEVTQIGAETRPSVSAHPQQNAPSDRSSPLSTASRGDRSHKMPAGACRNAPRPSRRSSLLSGKRRWRWGRRGARRVGSLFHSPPLV